MDGLGSPSPNIYECVDLLRVPGCPPSHINAFPTIQDCCAPVSMIHDSILGLLALKLIEVKPDLFASLSLRCVVDLSWIWSPCPWIWILFCFC